VARTEVLYGIIVKLISDGICICARGKNATLSVYYSRNEKATAAAGHEPYQTFRGSLVELDLAGRQRRQQNPVALDVWHSDIKPVSGE